MPSKEMQEALKKIVVPELRARGFTGSYPNFRRIRDGHIDLLSFQFSMYQQAFVLNIALCPASGIITSWGKVIPPQKTNPSWVESFRDRHRLVPIEGNNEKWFEFESVDPVLVAKSVIPYLDQGEHWWQVARLRSVWNQQDRPAGDQPAGRQELS